MTDIQVRRAKPERRRGLGRACVAALLDWFRDETAVGQIELHATQEGIDLYRALGFIDASYPRCASASSE